MLFRSDLPVNVTMSPVALNNIKQSITLYPNPTNDFVNVVSTEKGQINIYDVNGRLLQRIEMTSEKQTIDISNLPTGIYNFQINGVNNKVIKK